MQPQPLAAALIVVLPREAGVAMLDSCVSSFCEVSQVSSLALVDTNPTPRTLALSASIPARVKVHHSRCNLWEAAQGLNCALEVARADGCSFVLWGFSVETLVGINSPTLCRDSLPAEWPQLDVLQLYSDAMHMPLRDFFRADAFRFVGSGFPVPVLLPASGPVSPIRAVAAWPAARLSMLAPECALTPVEAAMITAKLEEEAEAEAAGASFKAPRGSSAGSAESGYAFVGPGGYSTLSSAAPNGSGSGSGGGGDDAAVEALAMVKLLHACQCASWGVVRQLGRERARQGSMGWGGQHGGYAARMMQLGAEGSLREESTLEHVMDAANTALELGRLGGIRNLLKEALDSKREGLEHLASAALSSAVAAAAGNPPRPCWHPMSVDALWLSQSVLAFAALLRSDSAPTGSWEAAEAVALLANAAADTNGRDHAKSRKWLANATGVAEHHVTSNPVDKLPLPCRPGDWVAPTMAVYRGLWPTVNVAFANRALAATPYFQHLVRTTLLGVAGLPSRCDMVPLQLFSVVASDVVGVPALQVPSSMAVTAVVSSIPPSSLLCVCAGNSGPALLQDVGDALFSAALPTGFRLTFSNLEGAALHVVEGALPDAFVVLLVGLFNLETPGGTRRQHVAQRTPTTPRFPGGSGYPASYYDPYASKRYEQPSK